MLPVSELCKRVSLPPEEVKEVNVKWIFKFTSFLFFDEVLKELTEEEKLFYSESEGKVYQV